MTFQLELMRSFGMFGFQVPEEYGGLGLSNVEMARMCEIGGELDLSTSIFIGAHQSIGFKVRLTRTLSKRRRLTFRGAFGDFLIVKSLRPKMFIPAKKTLTTYLLYRLP